MGRAKPRELRRKEQKSFSVSTGQGFAWGLNPYDISLMGLQFSTVSVQSGMKMDHRVASTSANILQVLLLYAVHVLVPATLLLSTAKRSILRYITIPFSLCILYQAIQVASLLGPGFAWCELTRLFLTVSCQSLNLLLISPKDDQDVPLSAGRSVWHRLYQASKLFTHPRAIGTPWQISNAPPHPAYYKQKHMNVPPRRQFLIRQIAIVLWQYLALDLFAYLALQQAIEQEKSGPLPPTVEWNLTTEKWIERIVSNLMAGFVVSRILIDFHHRVFSIIAVGIGLDSTSDWPPLFGRATEADSLRGFWS